MKLSTIRILFILAFIIIYAAILYFNTQNKATLINNELKEATKELQINYDISISIYTNDAKAINAHLSQNKSLLNLLSKIKDANYEERKKLREMPQ